MSEYVFVNEQIKNLSILILADIPCTAIQWKSELPAITEDKKIRTNGFFHEWKYNKDKRR